MKAVALDLDGFTGGGQTAIGDLADAVRSVRAAGKPVVAYGVGYTDDSYQLASAASEIWLNPLGAVLITGPGGSNLYYKGLLDKLGVTANVYRVGTYKSAVEPFIRNDMSPEAKQNYLALDEATLETWRQSVKQARPKANVDLFLKDMNGAVAAAGGDMAKAAVIAGLVDKIGDRTAFEARLAQLGGTERRNGEGGFSRIKLGSYVADMVDEKPTGPIGVATIAGMIVDGKAGPGTAGGDTIAKEIESGVRDKGIKALVVRIDSPGGSVLASERIRQALLEAKAKDPGRGFDGQRRRLGRLLGRDPGRLHLRRALDDHRVDRRVRSPSELPGNAPEARDRRRRGEDDATVGRTRLDEGPSPEANKLIQSGVNAMYARFLNIVAASRHKTPQQVDQIAQGRVWDGGTARQIGLVDGFGGMTEAIAKAAELAKLGDQRGIRYLEPRPSFRDELVRTLSSEDSDDSAVPADAFAMLAVKPQQQLASVIAEMRSILSGPSIQARCLECPAVAPVAGQARDSGLLALLKAWLS